MNIEKKYSGNLYKNSKNIWEYDDGFVRWLKDNSLRFTSVHEMAKYIGVGLEFGYKLKKRHDLKFKAKKNSPEFKAEYQNYDWCYRRFITEGLNHDEMAIQAGCTKRTIEKWCVEKHRITQKMRQKIKTPSKLQHDLIIGSILGDGHIDKREGQPIFIVSHAENQKDYLYWKYEIMKDICNSPPSFVKGEKQHFNGAINKTYNKQNSYRVSSRIQDYLIEYKNMSTLECLDKLNEFSFAVWILDDGYRGSSNWSLCVAGFSQPEKDFALQVLSGKFGLKPYIRNSDDRYIVFNAIDSRAIDNIILNNVPNKMDIVQYKITDKINKEAI